MLSVNIQPVASLEKQNRTIVIGFLRSEGVDATGLHFHQAVPPVGPGHTEVVDGSPEDVEGLSLQGELRRVGTQAHLPAYSPSACWHAGRGAAAYLCHTHIIQHIDDCA